jgi:hypothetical protein
VSQTERRCPSCGALVAADAGWCGQCLRPLREEPAPRPAPVRVTPEPGQSERVPTWTCPSCEHVNAIELDRCEVCGTPFAQLFAEPETRVEIAPGRAVGWSLLLPGLGHWMAGRKLDAVARMALFAWTFGAVVVLFLSRSSGGLGRGGALLGLYGVSAVAVYAISAVDARRIAVGEEPVVSSRVLLWASVGLVVVSVVLATLLALPITRGG